MGYEGCERQKLYAWKGATLYRFRPYTHQSTSPILIVYALVNTSKILDLHSQCSFIDHLLAQNMDVYLLEWDKPSLKPTRTLFDYIFKDIHQAISCVCDFLSCEQIHLMGICQGGYFCLCYATLFPEKIMSFIPIVTPIDFDTPQNRLFQLVSYVDFAPMVDIFGNLPGECIKMFLEQIQPFYRLQKKWRAFSQSDPVEIEIFHAVEKWSQDCPAQEGKAFLEFVEQGIQKNALVKGELILNGYPICLEKIQIPILNIYATEDPFWPKATVQALGQYYTGKKYQEYAYQGGHIGIFIRSKALKDIPIQIKKWVESIK